MQVSIVIPTFNRLPRLKRVLAALHKQTVAPEEFEVIVVSDGSTDGTDAYLRSVQTPLRLVPVLQPNRGVAAARNAGVAQAQGELIVFLDDDVVPAPDLISEHLQLHAAHGENMVVLGPMLTPDDAALQPWVQWEQAMLIKNYAAMQQGRWSPTPRQFYTGNASLARQHIVEAGGFNEAFRRAEDVELAYRLAARGLRFVFHAEAIGYHYAERSFGSWLATPYAYGRNDVLFAREGGQSWLLPVVFEEIHYRKKLIQWLVRHCLDRPLASAAVVTALRWLAAIGAYSGWDKLPQHAYSGIFNLRYYQGVADELGGRAAFFHEMRRAKLLLSSGADAEQPMTGA
ncbi:MAG TPA: exopolysaccharide biosynthesis glycosyltransferase EpsD [Roseiflexaceae bacterium]|jgi:GT2 family glycosyltransferase|nr:exopolysaccharide biosynthesis glycosyltransferase EpsD [Roseiflexaceae bacterium]